MSKVFTPKPITYRPPPIVLPKVQTRPGQMPVVQPKGK